MSVADFLKNISSGRLDNIYADSQAAFYLLDKPKGLHSFKLVATLRKSLGIKKVGFAGTLDPLASGLMILATGSATKLLDLFHQLPKTYLADITFGQTSASFDKEKEVVINKGAKSFERAVLEEKLANFLGQQEQTVPIFSAKKVAGQKLNKLARSGKSVAALPKNKIEIYDIEIIDFKYPQLKLKIVCSAGSYIRSLVNDLGEEMGTGAILSDLRRTQIGPIKVEQAWQLENASPIEIKAQAIKPQALITSLK